MPGFKGLAVPGPTNMPFEIRQAMDVALEDHRAPDFPEFTLPLFADLRDQWGLKDRIRLVASGKLVNPGDVAWALAAGADFVTSARGFMFALGCIQALKCNKNTCPTGITTHDPRFQKGLVVEDKYVRVARYAKEIIGTTIPNKSIELSNMYYKRYKKQSSHEFVDLKFDTIMEKLNLPKLGQHDALNDAVMSGMMYLKLKDMPEYKGAFS